MGLSPYFMPFGGVIHKSTSPTADTTDFLYILSFSKTKRSYQQMKIICSKSNLLKSVNIVMKAVPGKTTMPILECILMDASSNEIKFTTNDMELGIETKVEGEILEKGIIAIDAKIFSEIVRKLPDNDVTITTDEKMQAVITCEKAKFNISGQSGEDFSYLPYVEKNDSITLSQFTLKEVVRQTIFSIAANENNKMMTGELFEVDGNILKVVSLDGHRISIRKIELKDSYPHKKVVVPGKTLIEVSKILSGETEDEISIFFTENHIVFEFANTVVVSRLIEGEYFRIDQMLSSDYETKVEINKREFLDCIDRATLLVKEGDKKPIIIAIGEGSMELKINSQIGSMNEQIDISKEGKDILIGFNPKFLIDALRVIDDETITIYLVNPKAPCFIRDENQSYIYLILPVNFTA
jgi:DNA polymerase-3 subunit beta